MIPGPMFPTGYYKFNINPYENDIIRQMNDLQARCNALEAENVQLKNMIT